MLFQTWIVEEYYFDKLMTIYLTSCDVCMFLLIYCNDRTFQCCSFLFPSSLTRAGLHLCNHVLTQNFYMRKCGLIFSATCLWQMEKTTLHRPRINFLYRQWFFLTCQLELWTKRKTLSEFTFIGNAQNHVIASQKCICMWK